MGMFLQLVVCPAVQILGMFSHAVMGGNSYAQWWVSVGSLLLAGDVLYGRACGGVVQICWGGTSFNQVELGSKGEKWPPFDDFKASFHLSWCYCCVAL